MPKKCKTKKRGFRQMSMESNPYSIGADNNNFSGDSQSMANSIYGDTQGAMMVSNLQPQKQNTAGYESVAMPKQTSSNTTNLSNSVVPLQVQQSNYAGVTPVNSTATGGAPGPDVNYFMPSNMENQNQPSNDQKGLGDMLGEGLGKLGKGVGKLFKPGGTLGKRTDQGFEERIAKAKAQGRDAQVARLEKRYKKFSGLQEYKAAKTGQSHLKKKDRTGLAAEKRKDVVNKALSGPVPTAAKPPAPPVSFKIDPKTQEIFDKNAKGELFKTKSLSELATSLFKN